MKEDQPASWEDQPASILGVSSPVLGLRVPTDVIHAIWLLPSSVITCGRSSDRVVRRTPCSCGELLAMILLSPESPSMTRVCPTGSYVTYLQKVCISYAIRIPPGISKRGAGWTWWSVSCHAMPRPSCERWHGNHVARSFSEIQYAAPMTGPSTLICPTRKMRPSL